MSVVHVIGTGGTIASRGQTGGPVVADSADQVLEDLGLPVAVTTEDALHINSFHLTFADLVTIYDAVHAACARAEVDGVVITHGTDTMEETAFFLSLFHNVPKPVVLTGAQRAADVANTDGPENLRQAVEAAGSVTMRDAGVVIGFEGQFHAARHTRKQHTLATTTFYGGTLVAQYYNGVLTRLATAAQHPVLQPPTAAFAQLNIPVIDAPPGSTADLLYAAVDAGVHGIVLQGVGAGNAPSAFTAGVETAVQAGIPVVLSTRVPAGPIAALYGNGGGVTLLGAGALSAGQLNTYQARILLAVLLSQQHDHGTLRTAFESQTG